MTLPRDTTPEAAAVQRRVFEKMTGAQRFALACEMSDELRRVARDGARHHDDEERSERRHDGRRAR